MYHISWHEFIKLTIIFQSKTKTAQKYKKMQTIKKKLRESFEMFWCASEDLKIWFLKILWDFLGRREYFDSLATHLFINDDIFKDDDTLDTPSSLVH